MPAAIASAGPENVDRLAAQLDLAGRARMQAVEDVHQGRFAGAVFADERVHLAAADLQRGVVDGDEIAEVFTMSAHGITNGVIGALSFSGRGRRGEAAMDGDAAGDRQSRRRP